MNSGLGGRVCRNQPWLESEMVRANRRITLEEIEDGLNEDCSHFSVHNIVSETLGYRKVSARWVDKWLKEAAGEWYNTGITKLVDRMKKVIEHQGDYVGRGNLGALENKGTKSFLRSLRLGVEATSSERNTRRWFLKFKVGHFRLENQDGRGRRSTFKHEDLKSHIESNNTQTVYEVSVELNALKSTIARHIH
ncbi:ZHX3 [Cordylochernes scorpioides]|uniref:ZHX3 n=1 Tax=Cordylochernes scorpioides TaxID=51811 RepID=A0ABY6K3W3_9ARAC|nr:ZHX3 [Cordylochernes scorpioides]